MQRNEIVLKADLIKKKLEKVVSTNQEAKSLQGQRLVKGQSQKSIFCHGLQHLAKANKTFVIKKNPNLKFKVWN